MVSLLTYLWKCMSTSGFGEESVMVLENTGQPEVRGLMLGKRDATSGGA